MNWLGKSLWDDVERLKGDGWKIVETIVPDSAWGEITEVLMERHGGRERQTLHALCHPPDADGPTDEGLAYLDRLDGWHGPPHG
jgi:hypothetical protein